jgi:hypothetical protein
VGGGGIGKVAVARGDGGAGLDEKVPSAPVAINDAKPTSSTTAPSERSVLYRLMPPLIIERASAKGCPANDRPALAGPVASVGTSHP